MKFGVRQKILLILGLALVLSLSISGWLALRAQTESISRDIDQQGRSMARLMARVLAFSVVSYDYHTIEMLLKDVVGHGDMVYAKVLSAQGNVMAESAHASAGAQRVFEHDIAIEDQRIGKLVLGIGTERISRNTERELRAIVARELVVILIIVLIELAALSYFLVRPIVAMSRALNARATGGVPVLSRDEIGAVAEQFNHLYRDLDLMNAKLRSKVEAADRELQLTNERLRMQSEQLSLANRELEKLSITDALTGLYNRRYVDSLLQTVQREAQRCGSVLLLDIDYFKQFNDRYGHAVGDAILRELSARIRARLRKSDVVCRLGGDEFLVFCPGASGQAAQQLGETLRASAAQQDFSVGELSLTVTISVGVAELDPQADAHAFMRLADVALYRSKHAGRNRVTFLAAGQVAV